MTDDSTHKIRGCKLYRSWRSGLLCKQKQALYSTLNILAHPATYLCLSTPRFRLLLFYVLTQLTAPDSLALSLLHTERVYYTLPSPLTCVSPPWLPSLVHLVPSPAAPRPCVCECVIDNLEPARRGKQGAAVAQTQSSCITPDIHAGKRLQPYALALTQAIPWTLCSGCVMRVGSHHVRSRHIQPHTL